MKNPDGRNRDGNQKDDPGKMFAKPRKNSMTVSSFGELSERSKEVELPTVVQNKVSRRFNSIKKKNTTLNQYGANKANG